MATLKTAPTGVSVDDFLNTVDEEQKRADCFAIVEMMEKATKSPAKMWGSSIVGFGDYRCKYASGREIDWFYMGFAPRKADITLYLTCDLEGSFGDELKELGKYKAGKGCLHIKRLSDIKVPVLKRLIKQALADLKKQK